MTESTAFTGTKLVVPEQSYAFFADYFDFGIAQTNGRCAPSLAPRAVPPTPPPPRRSSPPPACSFQIFEIDFLDSNFQGSASMFESVYAAEQWYAGMADAALERSITLQYCLPSATDIMIALQFPAVVQARGRGSGGEGRAAMCSLRWVTPPLAVPCAGPGERRLRQHRRQRGRARGLHAPHGRTRRRAVQGYALDHVPAAADVSSCGTSGGEATPHAPPAACRSNDEINRNYTTQPHTELDCVLATLSMGPVGISDALNYTNVPLISQVRRMRGRRVFILTLQAARHPPPHTHNLSPGRPSCPRRTARSSGPAAPCPGSTPSLQT